MIIKKRGIFKKCASFFIDFNHQIGFFWFYNIRNSKFVNRNSFHAILISKILATTVGVISAFSPKFTPLSSKRFTILAIVS